MDEISITDHDLAAMCRLCLSRRYVDLFDVFSFSPRFEDQLLADVIMKCAPVQILRRDEMPKFICRFCYTELEKFYQFQMQVIESDKTLRRYVEQLHAFDKKSKLDGFIQSPSEDPLVAKTHANNFVKCESVELHNMFDSNVNWRGQEYENLNSAVKISYEMSLKSNIKDEQIDDYSIIAQECADNTGVTSSEDCDVSCNIGDSNLVEDINWKLEEPANFLSTCKINEKMPLKYEIKLEPMDDKSLIPKESIVDTINSSSNDVGNEISCEDTKVAGDHTSGNFAYVRVADEGESFEKCEKKNTSVKRNHAGKKPYQCDVCNKCYSQANRLNVHKRIHTGERPYQCNVCNMSFTRSDNFEVHNRIHTGEKPYQCDVCNKCFCQLNHLNVHKQIHTGEKYQCDVCNKCFFESSKLNVHKQIHAGEKPYQCDVCNKCFFESSKLKVHKRIHTGEKQYQCDVCNKCFIESSKLKLHKRIHTGEKPYQCDVCNKSFSQSSSLKVHKLIHTGEKPYQCDVCNRCFSLSNRLKAHKRIHTA